MLKKRFSWVLRVLRTILQLVILTHLNNISETPCQEQEQENKGENKENKGADRSAHPVK